MTDYKNSLLMPKTSFSMKGNLPQNEEKMQEKWNEMGIYQKVLDAKKQFPSFILHDGPPYANGDLHIGHALNKILKDFILRYKSMAGFYAPYVPGWDTHGLPIENKVEKQKGVHRKDLSISEFRQKCAAYAKQQISNQKSQFQKLLVRGDWSNPYLTMNPHFEAEQIKLFGEMAQKGFIYKGKKPVNWSPSSETALADAEIEYFDKRSASIYVAFTVREGKEGVQSGDKVVIWTTTPWTLPANVAIAVHPNSTYVLVSIQGENFVIAEGLLPSVKSKLEWEDPVVLKTFPGRALEGVVCEHPFYKRMSPLVLGQHVTLESGTGCVHTAPGHGYEDFEMARKYNLDILCPVNENGMMTKEAPGFEGLFYEEANKKVTQWLSAKNALLKMEFITHSYPHDWRTKKPTIFRATPQWFASIEPFRTQLLSEIDRVHWVNEWGKTRLYNMIRDRGDWCISRQRVWGVPIPVFYGENGDTILTPETIAHVAELVRKHGSNIWFEWDASALLPGGFTHPSSPNGHFFKETDIMDVWFDSGSSYRSVLGEEPADLYLEGSDQYRGWFNSSLITSVASRGVAPYRSVLSHGFVLDGKGNKMSKSEGNVVSPNQVISRYGADVLRLWVASVNYLEDVRISEDILKQISESYRKIRNSFRFMIGNLSDFDKKRDAISDLSSLKDVDRYMFVKLNILLEEVQKEYETYNFVGIYRLLIQFCTVDLSSFYFEYAKDILYCDAQNAFRRRSAQTFLYHALVSLSKLIAPLLPYTAEEVWAFTQESEESVQLADFPSMFQISSQNVISSVWVQFFALREEVLKELEVKRTKKEIGKSLEATLILTRSFIADIEDIERLFVVSKVEFVEEDHVLQVIPAKAEKCERCWNMDESVGLYKTYPHLCNRCISVVES